MFDRSYNGDYKLEDKIYEFNESYIYTGLNLIIIINNSCSIYWDDEIFG